MKLASAEWFKQTGLGISITQSAIRAVCIDGARQITSSGQVALEVDTFGQNQIQKEPLQLAIKQLLTQLDKKEAYAAVTLPEYYSYTRTYSLPSMPLDEVGEALQWQIEKILPLPKDSIYFDWKLIEETPTNISVLIIAMARSTLDSMIEIFESTGIKPVSFEPSTTAVSRVIQSTIKQTTILVEINPKGSSATLIDAGVSRLTVTNQFSSVNAEEIKLALQKTGISVQSLINYVHNQQTQPSDDQIRILLSGESASGEVAQWLATLLNRSIELLDIPQVPIQFHQAFAAATAHLLPHKEGYSVNLLPDTLREFYDASKDHSRMFDKLKTIGLLGGVSVLISSLGLAWAFGRAQMSNSQLLDLSNRNGEFALDSNQVAAINQSSQAVVSLFSAKTSPVDQMVTIYGLQPNGVRISSVMYDKDLGQITLTGTAEERSVLLDYVNLLKGESALFSQVNLPIEALEKPTDLNFSLTISLSKPS